MYAFNKRSKIILTGAAFLILVALVAMGSFPINDSASSAIKDTPLPTVTPGLVVYGVVRDLSGSGVENVSIYRGYASYQGVVIATTDATGIYQSDFYYIPGDEMVRVWAERSGLVFAPMQYYWRHYHGYQRAECNFQARLPWVLYIPFMGKFSN